MFLLLLGVVVLCPPYPPTHTHTHTRTHARTHARTHDLLRYTEIHAFEFHDAFDDTRSNAEVYPSVLQPHLDA